jgi:Alginate O-acetyl transferase AlgF.
MQYNITCETLNIWNIGSFPKSYIRVLHAVPDAPKVDVYADDQLIAKDLAFGKYTDYVSVPEGNYEITVYAAGTKSNPVLDHMLMIRPDTTHTVAAVGTLNSIGLLAIPDRMDGTEHGKSLVRFCHLSPNAPAVDITLPDGTILFSNVSFKQLTQYLAVDPMTYTLQVRPAGTSTVVLTVPNVDLKPGMVYTIYAIGLVGKEPELSALLVTDGMNQ